MPDYNIPRILEGLEESFDKRIVRDFLAEYEQRRQELKDWRSLLTEEQRHNLDFASLYAMCFEGQLRDGHLLVLISKLRGLLDSAVGFL